MSAPKFAHFRPGPSSRIVGGVRILADKARALKALRRLRDRLVVGFPWLPDSADGKQARKEIVEEIVLLNELIWERNREVMS